MAALDRVTRGAMAAHVVLILFATLAMVTILAGDFPVWMQKPYTARVYELSWKYTGQVYVILGLVAAVCHAGPRIGWPRTFAVFGAASGIALTSELLGTNVGLPFGAYHYTEMLGYRVLGDVPYVIPLSWSYMLYACLAMCGRVFTREHRPWVWALCAGAMLTAWDVALEVHMTNIVPAHWAWDFARMPSWMPAWLTTPIYYGMPLSNWIGWLLTATVIARVMIALVPADVWRRAVSPATLPLWLYAVNGIMPVATTARHGLLGAALLGGAAMGLVLTLAMRRGAVSRAQGAERR